MSEHAYSDEQVRFFYRSIYGEGPTVLSGDDMLNRLSKAGIVVWFPDPLEPRYYAEPGAFSPSWEVRDRNSPEKAAAFFTGEKADVYARRHARYLNEVSA